MRPASTQTAELAATGEPTKQVYVIDDDSELRRSLKFLLSTAGFVSWPFASASDFIDNLPNLKPAPILVDVRMEPISGIELMAILSERGINWPVIVMTGHGEIPIAVQAIKLGAIEFLEKPFEFESLAAALQTAMTELSSIAAAEESKLRSKRLFAALTSRELEVMQELMKGSPNKMAAYNLALSVRTIEMHRANALAKLECKSIAEVIRIARDAGIVV